jgi:two-component system chemotaxis response regulator CheB
VNKIRVLVVDDSVVIRRLLTDVLARERDIEVVGTAPNGRIALAKLPHLNPDLVTLDVEMPEMDGLETLPHIRKTYPTLPVVMFSTLTSRGAVATLDAPREQQNQRVTKAWAHGFHGKRRRPGWANGTTKIARQGRAIG